MSAPDEIRQLADRLDAEADADDHGCSEVGNWSGGYDCLCGRSAWYTHLSCPPHQGCMFEYQNRAAAVALRHHANLIDAIGDPDELLAMSCYGTANNGHGDDLNDAVNRIAAAVSPPPAPTTEDET